MPLEASDYENQVDLIKAGKNYEGDLPGAKLTKDHIALLLQICIQC